MKKGSIYTPHFLTKTKIGYYSSAGSHLKGISPLYGMFLLGPVVIHRFWGSIPSQVLYYLKNRPRRSTKFIFFYNPQVYHYRFSKVDGYPLYKSRSLCFKKAMRTTNRLVELEIMISKKLPKNQSFFFQHTFKLAMKQLIQLLTPIQPFNK